MPRTNPFFHGQAKLYIVLFCFRDILPLPQYISLKDIWVFISTSAALTDTKLNSFIYIYILKVFTEWVVHMSFVWHYYTLYTVFFSFRFLHIYWFALFIPLHILLLFLFFYHIYALVLCYFYIIFYYFALSTERTWFDLHFTSNYTLYNWLCDK